ncbi:hypothetical protein RFI_26702 [Reticulomyxa filosa]|uniref:Uncharacterized protein n=1 Tax=Reticulomyxa filosa TaxID=46433 RepID=X6MCA7_RETFI|nr:hypothetical protein RFI_26702 [Reticulomyxa filosa]|eukprot:ETO10675.1 hypothetical protein RFI_26702 [Reticulomyxa filosa]
MSFSLILEQVKIFLVVKCEQQAPIFWRYKTAFWNFYETICLNQPVNHLQFRHTKSDKHNKTKSNKQCQKQSAKFLTLTKTKKKLMDAIITSFSKKKRISYQHIYGKKKTEKKQKRKKGSKAKPNPRSNFDKPPKIKCTCPNPPNKEIK